MAEPIPLIFLPGMAADERLFAAQVAAFPNLRVQPWIAPLPCESLCAYARRLAAVVDPGRPCVVGGASFGGVVALEMAQHLDSLACILIGSVRSPSGLPRRWRLLRPVATLGPGALRVLCLLGSRLGRWFLKPGTVRRLEKLSRPEAAFVRWAMCAVVRWRPSTGVAGTRVFHIHGEYDRVLPVALAKPDVIVPGGQHALTLFNPSAVNQFIANVMRSVEKQNAPDS